MSGENNFKDTVNSLFKGLDAFISAKIVVGEAIHVGDTIILPLVDVSFGVGAGAFEGEKKNNGGGGMTGKLTPSAVLVIQNGSTKLVNVKNQDGLTKVLDMVPDFVDRFASGFGRSKACCAGAGSERGSCTGEASTGWAGSCTGCCAA